MYSTIYVMPYHIVAPDRKPRNHAFYGVNEVLSYLYLCLWTALHQFLCCDLMVYEMCFDRVTVTKCTLRRDGWVYITDFKFVVHMGMNLQFMYCAAMATPLVIGSIFTASEFGGKTYVIARLTLTETALFPFVSWRLFLLIRLCLQVIFLKKYN